MKNLILVIAALFFFFLFPLEKVLANETLWKVQSIDTMKFSRDAARQHLSTHTIDQQLEKIAQAGATHVAVDTPYDEEFYPVLKTWETEARKYHLSIWFRGNFSGWEGWFDYPKITRSEHKAKLEEFLNKHQDLFENGDVFTSCPECENGGPGNPRETGDVKGFRDFLISENTLASDIFIKNNKQVITNYYSMNGDVASLVMDKKTTNALGGVVTIDHYVATPEKLKDDIKKLSKNSGGKIMIGEIGAPIPDIHGYMTEDQQADWIAKTFDELYQSSDVIGVNYWTSFGGTTSIWTDAGSSKKAVGVISSAFLPLMYTGRVTNQFGKGVENATVAFGEKQVKTNYNGYFSIPVIQPTQITISSKNYKKATAIVDRKASQTVFTIEKQNPTVFDKLYKVIHCYVIICKK